MSRCVRLLLLLCLVFPFQGGEASGQMQENRPRRGGEERPPQRRTYLSLGSGYSFLVSHQGIDEFWNGRIAGSALFMVNIAYGVSLGAGVDATRIKFDRQAFVTRFPGVPQLARDILMVNIYVAWRYTPLPTWRSQPFIGVDIGASHMTGASYKEVISGVRRIYYDLPARTRLMGAAVVGVDIHPTVWLALEFQGKAVGLYNDDDFGIGLLALGGLRFRL